MDELTLFNQYPIFQILSYVITVFIGVVLHKYVTLILSYKSENKDRDASHNQQLIENLQNRINNLSKTVDNFDKERIEVHKRELERVKELTETKAQIQVLTLKIQYLEESLNREKEVNRKYRKKYGDIDEEN